MSVAALNFNATKLSGAIHLPQDQSHALPT
jgi:hypothetical protein